MSDVAIKVEKLSKLYRLGDIGTGTISHDLNRWWAKVRGKEDPFAKVAVSNDRSKKAAEYVWSLQDINFEIKKGEAVGIIGKNGAGKSTLLKLLSRVTSPTEGNIKINGRVASLLEVGTGFHGDLTGRENIYMNGAILGMTRAEVTKKMEEIVEFSGCAAYIDTPVKRYSSGMYVRLAFAVAAHLEPEILIVDEVLAVGDAEFQKKCLGKMQDVSSNGGRTVLFVSHNMASIKSLCPKGILLKNGGLQMVGETSKVLEEYQLGSQLRENGEREEIPSSSTYFTKWELDTPLSYAVYSRETVDFVFHLKVGENTTNAELGFLIRNGQGDIVYGVNTRDNNGALFQLEKGEYVFRFTVRLPIAAGSYQADIALASNNKLIDHWVSETKFKILSDHVSHLSLQWTGILNETFSFQFEKK